MNVHEIEGLLKIIEHPFSAALIAELHAWQTKTVNRAWLASVGRFWTRDDDDLLVEYDAIREPLLTAETAVKHAPPRSLLIVGEHRSGELEGRIKRLVDELSADKRVLWYIPEFVQIVTSGRHSGQAASILDQILPAISAGRMIVIGECTPGVLVKVQQVRPALRNAMDLVRLRAVWAEEAAGVANEFVQRLERTTGLSVESAVVPAASWPRRSRSICSARPSG